VTTGEPPALPKRSTVARAERHDRSADRPTRVCIVTPYLAEANNGNWRTAARWARMLRPAFQVHLQTAWKGSPCDALIALHAGRSAASVEAFARARPGRALIVVLTGTDLYGGLDPTALRSMDLATHLIVLNELGAARVPPQWRSKTHIVPPSATPLPPLAPRRRTFDVAVVGHLRAIKDPQMPMRIARRLPADSRIRLLHAGQALEARWSRVARATERATERYRWLGGLGAADARTLIRRSRLLLHPSKEEGAATVIVEALQAGTPVIASDCDGNVGLLGVGYPALFRTGDVEAALSLIVRAEREPRFLRRLQAAATRRARLYTPAREGRTLRHLVQNALRPGPRS
jgi:putative glycosyltransferase (TIGR04348 family)